MHNELVFWTDIDELLRGILYSTAANNIPKYSQFRSDTEGLHWCRPQAFETSMNTTQATTKPIKLRAQAIRVYLFRQVYNQNQ